MQGRGRWRHCLRGSRVIDGCRVDDDDDDHKFVKIGRKVAGRCKAVILLRCKRVKLELQLLHETNKVKVKVTLEQAKKV